MFESYPDIMTPEEARHALRVSKASIYRLLHSKQIQHFYVGRSIKIPKFALIDFLTAGCDNVVAMRQSELPERRSSWQ